MPTIRRGFLSSTATLLAVAPFAFACVVDINVGTTEELEMNPGAVSPHGARHLIVVTASGGAPHAFGTIKISQSPAGFVTFWDSATGGNLVANEFVEVTYNPLDQDPPDYCSYQGGPLTITLWIESDDAGVTTLTATWEGIDELIEPDEETKLSDSGKVTFVKVNALVWETYETNAVLEGCPKNGGKGIFPGKKSLQDTPGMTFDRRKVYVKATITPVFEDVNVYFKGWDVDDPSSNQAPIDDTPTSGPDNKGGNGAFLSTGASTASGTTDSAGEVKLCYVVGMNPGDNYRVSASCLQAALAPARLTQAQADSRTASEPNLVKITEMLTVWRRLHMEIDSMTTVAGNSVAGNIPKAPVAVGNDWRATTNQTLLDDDMYEKGTLVKGGQNFTVITGAGANNTAANSSWVVVTANPGQGAFTSLTDDDSETMPKTPDTSKLYSVFNAGPGCYLTFVNDGGGNAAWNTNNVPFTLGVNRAIATDADITALLLTNGDGNPGRNSDEVEDDSWWVIYIQGAYQAGWEEDCDPDSEVPCAGQSSDDREGVLIFSEGIRDWCLANGYTRSVVEQQVVAHDVGHLMKGSAPHTANTIMSATLPVASQHELFSDADINTIRSRTHSPGN